MVTTEPSGSYEMASRRAAEEIAEWIERCVGGWGAPPLWQRVQISTSLRDGTWRTDKPLRGLKERDLLIRRAEELGRRGVKLADMPAELQETVQAERERRRAKRERDKAESDRILADILAGQQTAIQERS